MANTHFRSTAFVIAAVITFGCQAGCGTDLTVPPTAEIQCATDADCPGELVCATAGQRCVDAEQLNDPAPVFIVLPTANGQRLSRESGHNNLEVTFSLNEDVGAEPPGLRVTLAGQLLPCTSTATASFDYTCSHLVGDSDTEGEHGVSVVATDEAWNVIEASTTVAFDFSPPALVAGIEPTITPAVAAEGELVLVRITLTEPVVDTPAPQLVASSDPTLVFDLVESSGGVLTFMRTVQLGDSGTVDLTLSNFVDEAGNPGVETVVGSVTFDGAAPAILNLAANRNRFSAESGFGHVVATFDSDEDLGVVSPGLDVRLGDDAMACSQSGAAPSFSYSCSYDIPPLAVGDPRAGVVRNVWISVRAEDTAGNRTLESIAVVLDFTPPQVALGSVFVQLFPEPALNPLPTVSAATNTTTVRAMFMLSEPLDGASPMPRIESAGGGLFTFVPELSSGLLLVYDWLVSGIAADQVFDEELLVVPPESLAPPEPAVIDAAGNPMAAATLAMVPIDTRVPALPDTATPGAVVYTRIPWGTDATFDGGAVASFSVAGQAGAVEPLSTVIVYDGADPTRAVELGRAQSDDTGAFGGAVGDPSALVINRADRQQVFVAAVDGAGNRSAATRVRDIVWTATLGNKVKGSSFENPHRLVGGPWSLGSLNQVDMSEADPAELGHVGGAGFAVQGAGIWIAREPSIDPGVRRWMRNTFDSVRGVVVSFGGWEGTVRNSNVWEWDGRAWALKIPVDPEADGNPDDRYAHALAYDSERRKSVLFGGAVIVGNKGDTWEWDGSSWALRIPDDPEGDGNPAPRQYHTMTFDSRRGRVVLFGGTTAPGINSDETWEWDGSSWALQTPTDPEGDGNPAAQIDVLLTYDVARGVSVLFGGASFGLNAETWEWDGVSWASHIPTDPEGDGNPAGAQGQAGCYDTKRGVTLLYSGKSGTTFIEELWAWDGTSWALLSPSAPGVVGNPAGRIYGSMAFDSARNVAFMSGGMISSAIPITDEAWEWDGQFWNRVWPWDPEGDGDPLAMDFLSTVYDSTRQVVHTFGDSLWEWNGNSWMGFPVIADPEGDGNPATPISDHAVAYDRVRNVVVLFGGEVPTGVAGDTWEWDGISWALRTPTDPEGDGDPPATRGAGMVFDESRGVSLMFGGLTGTTFLNDTWEWDGISWALRTPTDPEGDGDPPPGYLIRLAYDSHRSRAVLYGGVDATGAMNEQLWEWDGASWALRTVTDPEGDGNPIARTEHSLVYDRARHTVVLFGGMGTVVADLYNDLWEWDGSSWALRTSPDPFLNGPPVVRSSHGMAYDERRSRNMLFGGSSYGLPGIDTTWEWDGGAHARAIQTLEVAFGAAGGEATAQPASGLSVRWHALGVGYPAPACVASEGAELGVWDEGLWKWVATTADPTDPTLLQWSTSDPAQLRRLFFGPAATLNLAVRPREANGCNTTLGSITTDYVEVSVSYRLP